MRVLPANNSRLSSGHASILAQRQFSVNGNNNLSITVGDQSVLEFSDENNDYWQDKFEVKNSSLLPRYINSTYPFFISIDKNSTATIVNYRLIRLDDTRISDADWKYICQFYNGGYEIDTISVNNLNGIAFSIQKDNNCQCILDGNICHPDSIIVLLSYDNQYYIEVMSTEINQVNDINDLKHIIEMQKNSLLLINSDKNDNDNGEMLQIRQNLQNQHNEIVLTNGNEKDFSAYFAEGYYTNCISSNVLERNIKGEQVRLLFTSNGLLLYGNENPLIEWNIIATKYIYLNIFRSEILLLKTQNISFDKYYSFCSNFVAERYRDFDRRKIPVGFLGLHFRIMYEEYQRRKKSIKELNIRAERNTYRDDIIYGSDYQTPLVNSIIVVQPNEKRYPSLRIEKYDL